eukprot:c23671_g1_i1 orf=107-3535(+)
MAGVIPHQTDPAAGRGRGMPVVPPWIQGPNVSSAPPVSGPSLRPLQAHLSGSSASSVQMPAHAPGSGPPGLGSSGPSSNFGSALPMQVQPSGLPQLGQQQFVPSSNQQFQPGVGHPPSGMGPRIGMPPPSLPGASSSSFPTQPTQYSQMRPTPGQQAPPPAASPGLPLSVGQLQRPLLGGPPLRQTLAQPLGMPPPGNLGAPAATSFPTGSSVAYPPPQNMYRGTPGPFQNLGEPPKLQGTQPASQPPWQALSSQTSASASNLALQTGQSGSLGVNSAPETITSGVVMGTSGSSDWQELTAPDGRRYFYNKITKHSSWEKPLELKAPTEGSQPAPVPGMTTQTAPPMPSLPMMQYQAGVPGYPQPVSPRTVPPAVGSSRIDPNQIPRPTLSSVTSLFETRINSQAALPPSATSNFIVKDTGNCSPRFMRCTLNQIPCSADLLSTSGMPLALMIQPMALPHPSEDSIQVVDFGENGPVRCSRCKAYINPFMKFVDQGRRFVCNLCGFTNETPRDYHCNLGPDGRRRDADERPELCKGTVEFVATKEYMIRSPMPAVFFYLIDVSQTAVQIGATASACSAVQRALSDLPEGPDTKVGIATFDTTVHFYNLNRSLQQPSMLVVPDIEDVYTPLQTGLIVSVSECRQHLEQLLESIPAIFQTSQNPDSAFGAAIKGAFLAMKSTGGKLLVFHSALPSVGFGALSGREVEGRAGSTSGEKEANKLLQPADKTLKTLAIDFAEYQVCVDLFITTHAYVDIASLAVVPRTTGGQIYYYYPFSASTDSAKLYNDLRWNLTRPQGLEAVMRVRCSQGLQVQDYFGSFCKRIPTDVDLPAIDCDKTVMATFKHDDKFQDGSECCFQCALLYTTLYGQRRIRVMTLSLPCTSLLSTVFRGADLDAQFTYFLKQAVQEVSTTPLVQVREHATTSCVNILYTYRKYCATASSSGQLILPEALKLLPLYTLALTKSIGLRPDVRIDDRSYWLTRAVSLSASLSIPLVYPRMFAIHDLVSKELNNGELAPVLPLSSEHLDNEGIFLLENGEDAFVYAGKAVSPDVLHHLFGVQSVNEMTSSQFLLQEYDNAASKKVNAMVNEIRKQHCSYLRLRWCKRGDPIEFLFFSLMVEDKNSLGMSYVDFLVHIHRQIQNKMV